MVRPHTTDARSEDDTNALAVRLLEIDSCMLHSHDRCRHSKLSKEVHTLDLFSRDVNRRIVVLYLCGKARIEVSCIKACNGSRTAASLHHTVPEFSSRVADWRDGTDSCNDYSLKLSRHTHLQC